MPNHAHSRDLRAGRHSQVGNIYLVTATVENRCPVFEDWRLGRLVVNELRRAEQQGFSVSLAWVVMPDHIHWLLELRKGSLALLIKQIKARSAIAINKTKSDEGRLWQRSFHDRAVRREEDLQAVARYIVANPVRAGLVRRVGDYSLWDAVWV
ncbi:MAG: REP-associated tyrosine transposase [Pseudomonas sp.]